MSNEVGRVLKQTVLAYFMAVFQYSLEQCARACGCD
jgi:hypothetical protein